jgi:ferredoxin--NADP+ reductase
VGWDRYLDNLLRAFPREERGLRRCVGTLAKLGQALDRSAMTGSLAGYLRYALATGSQVGWSMRSLDALLRACDLGDEARAVMSNQWIAYLSPPGRVPAFAHAGYLQDYVGGGAYYPHGGGQTLSVALADVVRSHEGSIRTGARVERILIEGGRVRGVRLQHGEVMNTQCVVSAADYKRTLLDLVDASALPMRSLRRVRNARMAAPFFNVYLGLDCDLSARMCKTNLLSNPSWDDPNELARAHLEGATARTRDAWLKSAARRLGAFIHSSKVKDPACTRYAPEGCSDLEVMAAVPADRSFWGVDGADAAANGYRDNAVYSDLKERITEIMIQRAEEVLPGVRDHIVWREASTPLTHERYTLASDGTAYGLELNRAQFGPGRPTPHTPVRGLYLSGVSMAWGPGVEGAMLSGIHAASAVLQRRLFSEVRGGRVMADPRRLAEVPRAADPLRAARAPRQRARSASWVR